MFLQLEARVCLTQGPYLFSAVASTGDTVYAPGTGGAAIGNLSNISLGSINDSGNVAFLGTVGGYNGVVEPVTSGGTTTLTELSFTNRNFTFPQIDNNNDVIAQDQYLIGGSTLDTYIRLWHTDGTWTGKETGSSDSGDIDLIPVISPNGAHFAYQDNKSGSLFLMIDGSPAAVFPAGFGRPAAGDRQ